MGIKEIYGFCIDNNSYKYRRILATMTWLGGLMTMTRLRIAVEVDDYEISEAFGYLPDVFDGDEKPMIIDGSVIVNSDTFDVYRLLVKLLRLISRRINAEFKEYEDSCEASLTLQEMEAYVKFEKKIGMLCMSILQHT